MDPHHRNRCFAQWLLPRRQWPTLSAAAGQLPLMLLLYLASIAMVQAKPMELPDPSDSCDWTGSGLAAAAGDERVVVPIYLRCLTGSITWQYPASALQVTLKNGKEFRGCIKISANSTTRVRMYIEGHGSQSLHRLYSSDDGKPVQLERCFSSHDGQIALYLEADQSKAIIKRERFQFSYHLEPVRSNEVLSDEQEECRPCSDYEIHTAFCTSDFIIQGSISSLFDNRPLQRTELTIRASQIRKDLIPIDPAHKKPPPSSHTSARDIILYRPLKCGSKVGNGQFMFLGRWVLGNPVIKCAPTLYDWTRIREQAIRSGSNQCQLD